MAETIDYLNYSLNALAQASAAYQASEANKATKQHLENADSLAERNFEWQKQYGLSTLAQLEAERQTNAGIAKSNIEMQRDIANQNYALNKDISERNLQYMQDTFEYQKGLNELTMQREDNAYQRAVADLEAAGLSPLMLNGGASASSLSAGNAPQQNPYSYDASGIASAQGQYINLAKEYSSLLTAARGQHATRMQVASDNRQGAQLSLAQMSNQIGQQNVNMALQVSNIASNLAKFSQDYEYKKEQIKSLKGQNIFNSLHGYRNLNWQSELINIVSQLLQNGVNININNPFKNADGSNYGGKLPPVVEGYDNSSPSRQTDTNNSVYKLSQNYSVDACKTVWNDYPQLHNAFDDFNQFANWCKKKSNIIDLWNMINIK